MRLTCPNCGARYEAPDAMIPPEGRNVQCSDCGTTWFQAGRRDDAPPGAARVAGDAQAGAADARPPRREIDPGALNILREEAEREARLRAGRPATVETPTESPPSEPPDADHRGGRRARRPSLRAGLISIAVLAIVGAALHGNADAVADMAPWAEPHVRRFEGWVNAGLGWLDDMARTLAGPVGV